MGARKGDLVRARGAGADRETVEGILNLRYRKAWKSLMVDVILPNGLSVSVDPTSVEVLEAGKMSADLLDARDPISWEDGAISIRDLDAAMRQGLVRPERRSGTAPT